MSVKKTVKRMMMAPSFIILSGAIMGCALAPKVNQDPLVGTAVGGGLVLLLMTVL